MALGPVKREEGQSKLFKMEPLVEYTNAAWFCIILAIFRWAFDEFMIGLKNRMAAIQYMKAKTSAQWGLKLFMGCVAGGFTFWCVPYSGADTMLGIAKTGWGITHDSVIACVEATHSVMRGHACVAVFDNWYASLTLITILYSVYQIGCICTINSNRAGIPTWAFQMVETLRGNFSMHFWRPATLTVLSDSKIVGAITTVELPGDELVAMERKHRKGKSKKQDLAIKENLQVLEETEK